MRYRCSEMRTVFLRLSLNKLAPVDALYTVTERWDGTGARRRGARWSRQYVSLSQSGRGLKAGHNHQPRGIKWVNPQCARGTVLCYTTVLAGIVNRRFRDTCIANIRSVHFAVTPSPSISHGHDCVPTVEAQPIATPYRLCYCCSRLMMACS